MASINISEADFQAAFAGAHCCMENGEVASAKALDKLARKINAALSKSTASAAAGLFATRQPVTWKDVPSVFDKL